MQADAFPNCTMRPELLNALSDILQLTLAQVQFSKKKYTGLKYQVCVLMAWLVTGKSRMFHVSTGSCARFTVLHLRVAGCAEVSLYADMSVPLHVCVSV